MSQVLTVKPVTSSQKRLLITIEFAPKIHPEETEYSYQQPLTESYLSEPDWYYLLTNPNYEPTFERGGRCEAKQLVQPRC